MEFSKRDMKILKGLAILFMLSLHLFCRKDVGGLYETFPTINGVPFVYYLALFCDACVPIYCFASGYGLFVSLSKEENGILKKNFKRIFQLVINFWIILIMFSVVGLLVGKSGLPGSLNEFLLNFFVISYSYNGAWWFLQTYIILVFSMPLVFKIVNKYSPTRVLVVTFIIYFVTYLQRIKHVVDLGDHAALIMFVNTIVLVGTSLLPFIVGVIFAKEKIYSKIYNRFFRIPFKNTLCLLGIFLLVFFHGIEESLFVAPFTAIAFICLFSLMDKHVLVERALHFFSGHSTNIWLVHMFYYSTFISGIIFAPKYPVLILAWLVTLCIFTSYGVKMVYNPILRMTLNRAAIVNKNFSGMFGRKQVEH